MRSQSSIHSSMMDVNAMLNTTRDGPAAQSQISIHSSIMDVKAASDLRRQHLAPHLLPSGLDIHGETHMELVDDLVQGSIQRFLQSVCAPASQRPAWSLYRVLDAAQR